MIHHLYDMIDHLYSQEKYPDLAAAKTFQI